MSDVVIRQACVDDINKIFEIDNEYELDKYSADLIKKSLEDEFIINFIAEKDGQSIGYISATIVIDECNILKIVVARNFRHEGVATSLLQYTMQYAKNHGIKTVFLEVRKGNKVAKNFYEKNGFILEYKRQKYYDDGEDADIYYFYL